MAYDEIKYIEPSDQEKWVSDCTSDDHGNLTAKTEIAIGDQIKLTKDDLEIMINGKNELSYVNASINPSCLTVSEYTTNLDALTSLAGGVPAVILDFIKTGKLDVSAFASVQRNEVPKEALASLIWDQATSTFSGPAIELRKIYVIFRDSDISDKVLDKAFRSRSFCENMLEDTPEAIPGRDKAPIYTMPKSYPDRVTSVYATQAIENRNPLRTTRTIYTKL